MTDRPTTFTEAMTNPIDRAIFADSLDIALDGGCGHCDTERTHMCAGCGRCNCHTHHTCTRPTEEKPVIEHTIHCDKGPVTVQATSFVPGLLVYRIPDSVDVPSPYRWRLGHHSGFVIAAALSECEAHAGAHEIAGRTDWTRGATELRVTASDLVGMFEGLASVGCYLPEDAAAAIAEEATR